MVASFDEIFDKGVSKVKTVVSETSIEQRVFVKAFVQTCGDAASLGWHEANGGNLSYRLTPDEINSTRSYYNESPGSWESLGVQADSMRGELLLVTGSGSQFRMIPRDPAANIGIVEINPAGDAYRVVWGFKQSGRPTSEFVTHFVNHAVRKVVTAGANRVLYHAHPAQVAALTLSKDFNDRSLSRLFWKNMPESIMFVPEGISVVDWFIPGSKDLAIKTSEKMEVCKAVVWSRHGAFCAGDTLDEAFALMQVIEKASEICCTAHTVKDGFKFPGSLTDDQIKDMAKELQLQVNETYLD